MNPSRDTAFRWTGRVFYIAALVGLGIFGSYILLRAFGVTFANFHQWSGLFSGTPLEPSEWVASIGIGMHYFMGAVLVLATVWGVLFLHEPLTALQRLGAAMTLVAIFLGSLAPGRRRQP